jgi:hypothetical protein
MFQTQRLSIYIGEKLIHINTIYFVNCTIGMLRHRGPADLLNAHWNAGRLRHSRVGHPHHFCGGMIQVLPVDF